MRKRIYFAPDGASGQPEPKQPDKPEPDKPEPKQPEIHTAREV